jgi:hypothetical protein
MAGFIGPCGCGDIGAEDGELGSGLGDDELGGSSKVGWTAA